MRFDPRSPTFWASSFCSCLEKKGILNLAPPPEAALFVESSNTVNRSRQRQRKGERGGQRAIVSATAFVSGRSPDGIVGGGENRGRTFRFV